MKQGARTGTTGEIEIRRIETVQAFEELRKHWQALLPQSGANSAFLAWEWLYPWWKTKKGAQKLWLVTAWQTGELVGIAPLMLERQRHYGVSLRVLRSLGSPDIDISGFIARRELSGGPSERVLFALCREIARQGRHWDMILLNQFPQEDPGTQAILISFKKLGLALHEKTERHLYLSVQGRDWDSYFQSLSSRLRQDVRRMMRRAEKEGGITYLHHVGREVTQEDLSTVIAVNEHGRFPELYRAPEEQAFQRLLLEETSALGWPDLSLLYIDRQPVAFLYGLFYNHKLEAWRTGYDTAYFELAAGKIVLMRLLEEAFRRQYQEVDFLRGDEWYKNRLQVSERPYFWQIRLVSRWKPVPWFLIIAMPAIKEWVKGWMKRVKGNGKGAKEGQTQVKPDGTSQE